MLRDELKPVTGNKRRYLLYRLVSLDTKTALLLTGVTRGTYNSWCTTDPEFVGIHRRVKELSHEYRQEAMQMLRRDNQLAAVMLEAQVIHKIQEEVESGELNLTRTNLAREVYSKLITDLDHVPHVQQLTWEQRWQQIFTETQPQIEEGIVIEGEFREHLPAEIEAAEE